MSEGIDPHLTILLDIQKQLGVLGSETARQSEMLSSINTQVQKTNGRVTELERKNTEREKQENINRGKLMVVGAIGGTIASVVVAVIVKIISKL